MTINPDISGHFPVCLMMILIVSISYDHNSFLKVITCPVPKFGVKSLPGADRFDFLDNEKAAGFELKSPSGFLILKDLFILI
ncbi:MAG: hypothetical protein HLUCCX10_12430 [Algoriphagus marincola HL-49]|uniref:Uncharacterized protein n=1 Tax=Algoriphagus marincola HL-49 TaxID=1305737 RepID=A0A0P8BUT1_9BACT|nr:MAG: hypothetical protein HLUCCX10_12430 [Algoriphagus marincola HL-49]